MNRRYTDGRAWLSSCPVAHCERPVIEAHVDGLTLRLDTKAVPLKEALILDKHGVTVVNLWKGPTQLWVVAWFSDQGKVDKGHLYIRHRHDGPK